VTTSYDAAGRAVSSSDGTTYARYLVTPDGQVLAEQTYTENATTTEPGATPTFTFLLQDPDGNVATELEDDGTVAAQRAYDPYGAPDEGGTSEETGDEPSTLGFQGSHTDRATGSILLGPRIYDPTTERFTSPDFFVSSGADLSLGTDPLTGNRYLFAAANPVAFFDDGHEPYCGKDGSSSCETSPNRNRRNPAHTFRRPPKTALSFISSAIPPTAGQERPADTGPAWVNWAIVNWSGWEEVGNFAAGWGDAGSFGLTTWVRKRVGADDVVDKDAALYASGEVAGFLNLVAIGGAAAGSARTSGILASERGALGPFSRPIGPDMLNFRLALQSRSPKGRFPRWVKWAAGVVSLTYGYCQIEERC
jgi:RHS repeat-associated protein